jgi:hypothetical protein
MQIDILASESLGVRGLCCLVKTNERQIIIDPGIALGYLRHGLLPHPFQVAVGAQLRQEIVHVLGSATDIIISHYHGDHVPLVAANPYQLSMSSVADLMSEPQLWAAGPIGLSANMRRRREAIESAAGMNLTPVEGTNNGPFQFSLAMPHGEYGNGLGEVVMTRIECKGTVFVHASDIQLLEKRPISQILDWGPDIVLAGGPPLYLPQLSRASREKAWDNALRLAQGVPTLILDHHLLRSQRGIQWLDRLNASTRNRVVCAADFMKEKRRFLEAWRRRLYKELPVPENWHDDYVHGMVDTAGYTHWRDWRIQKST